MTIATTQLLEREVFLDALAAYAQDAASGNGRLVVVTGEAGIGKTTLIDAFRASHACAASGRRPAGALAARRAGRCPSRCRSR